MEISAWARQFIYANVYTLIYLVKTGDYATAMSAANELGKRGYVAELREIEADTTLRAVSRSMARGTLRYHIDKDGQWKA